MDRNAFRHELGQQLRVDSVRSSAAAGSGHPTSSMSAADLLAVLLDGHLRLDFKRPGDPRNDHLVFSKGHASPLLYACFKAVGAIGDEELMSFRKLGSRLEGHPTPLLPWVDVATGSLGQGLPVGVVLARTLKGRGVREVQDLPDKHGKPLTDPEHAIEELGGTRDLRVEVARPEGAPEPHRFETPGGERPRFEIGDEVATRKAYGEALRWLGDTRGDVVGLDGEVSNSTYSELFRHVHPERYFEMYIAEQQMIAAAVGMQRRGWKPFASTFAAFLTRAYDFVRMAAVSRAKLRLCGS